MAFGSKKETKKKTKAQREEDRAEEMLNIRKADLSLTAVSTAASVVSTMATIGLIATLNEKPKKKTKDDKMDYFYITDIFSQDGKEYKIYRKRKFQPITEGVYEHAIDRYYGLGKALPDTYKQEIGAYAGFYAENENRDSNYDVFVWMPDNTYQYASVPKKTIDAHNKDDSEENEGHIDDLRETIRSAKDYKKVWKEIVEYDILVNGTDDLKMRMSKDREVKEFLCRFQEYSEYVNRGNGSDILEIIEDYNDLYGPIKSPGIYFTDYGLLDPDSFEKDAKGNPLYDDEEQYLVKTIWKLHKKYYG